MHQKVLSMILVLVMLLGLLSVSAFTVKDTTSSDSADSTEFMRIFHLDCGRKYFSVSEIEGIIDQLAENHYTHLQLAFGNDGLREGRCHQGDATGKREPDLWLFR